MTYEARLKQYGPLPNPPFNNRETYLAWVAAWKENYADLSEKIRVFKVHGRLNQRFRGLTPKQIKKLPLSAREDRIWNADYPAAYWNGCGTWSEEATRQLVLRHQAKVTAQQQWEAAKEAQATAA